MLRLLPSYHSCPVVRTRNPTLLHACHTVVDVGGEYSNLTNRYDHHQRDFNATFPNRSTKLSSAGLIFVHFGKAIIALHLGVSEDQAQVSLVWEKLYESFIEALDAHDNGISVYEPKAVNAAGLQKRFSDSGFTLGAMVSRLNLNWNDSAPTDAVLAQAMEDKRFLAASTRIGEEFSRELDYYTKSWLPARELVHEAYIERLEHDSQGRLLVFSGQSMPWKDHLYIEEGQGEGANKVFYVLYPEDSTSDAKWRVQAVPLSKDSFESRKPLPEAWRGFRDEALVTVSGVSGGVFVHAAGFIGGNQTFEGAKEMAIKALDS